MSSTNLLLGCLGATLIAALIAGPFSVDSASNRAYAFTRTTQYRPAAWLTGADRFPAGAHIEVAAGDKTRALLPAFAASADACVSSDGKRILFSGKQSSAAPWQIWEVELDGGTPRRITSGNLGAIKPQYLPDNLIVYTHIAPGESYLETVPLAGGSPARLTFAPGRYLTNDVLHDGRILFEAQRTYERETVRELYTVYPDGTGVESLRCDHGRDRYSARQVSSRDVLFSVPGGLARFTSALSQQTTTDLPRAEYAGPVAEFPNGELIASTRASGNARFSLSAWNGTQHKLQSFADSDAVDPVVIAARETPRRFPSALMPERGAANLLCLNAHTTRDAEIHGALQKIRVFTQRAGKPQLLGESPVESDGSFYIQIPGEIPVRMELLDASGKIVRAERNWFWMRTGEQRVCVGCHAGPERAPDNNVPEILQKTTEPVKMRVTQ